MKNLKPLQYPLLTMALPETRNSIDISEGHRAVKRNGSLSASGKGRYLMPSSQDEIPRLDFEHCVTRHLVHGNFQAPVEEELDRGVRVLDAGCGTGRWVLEMVQDFPRSSFVGTDVAALYPKSDLPPNVAFIQADTLKGLPFPDDTFDFVFQRFMFLAFSPADWAIAVKELIRVTKPGGWIELFEYDMQLQRAGPSFDKLHAALTKVAATRGIDLRSVHHLPDLARSLEAVESDHVSAPLGWDGRASAATAWALRAEFSALRERLGSVLGLPEDEYEELVERMAGEMAQRRAWVTMPYLYGRKPDGSVE